MLCKYPIYSKKAGGHHKCGQCFPCRVNDRREKTFRLCLELGVAEKASWLTVTYAPAHVPKTVVDPESGVIYEDVFGLGLFTLDPWQFDGFIKRLRERIAPRQFRFFACGEYGDTFGRPHYHVCLFGLDTVNDRYDRLMVEQSWRDVATDSPLGKIRHYPLERKNMQYTCGYTVKKMTKPDDDRLYGRYPEFVSASKGIGRGAVPYFVKAIQPYIEEFGDVPSQWLLDGKMWPVPRYIKDKVRKELGITDEAKKLALEKWKNRMHDVSCVGAAASKNSTPLKIGSMIIGYKTESSPMYLAASGNHLLKGHVIDNMEAREKRKPKKGIF